MRDVKRSEEPTDEKCEKCGSPMVIKWGRFGKFMACSAYPGCKSTRELGGTGGEALPQVDEKCPKCGKPMATKKGRFGLFLACQEYPACKGTRKLVTLANGEVRAAQERILDEACPECGSKLRERAGRYGPFVSCSNYPDCRFIKRDETGVACPEPGCGGKIVRKRSKRGRVFYGCDRYPKCEFVLWAKPVPEACPACGAPFLVERVSKREGTVVRCDRKGCSYRRQTSAAGP
jgi:DNA topoisomerase-1